MRRMPGWTGSLLVRAGAAVLPASSSAGRQDAGRLSTRVLVLFLAGRDGGLAPLHRRDPSASSRAWLRPPPAAGGGRSSFGGTTSGERSRYSMPRFSMLVPPMPAMMPSMIFSSKVLSSSSSSVGARAARRSSRGRCPARRRRAAAPASASRRVPHHPTAGFGLAHRAVPVQDFRGRADSRRSAAPRHLLRARISRDQGAFAAGTPRKESYSRAATPATIATSARLNTYQLKVFPPIWT